MNQPLYLGKTRGLRRMANKAGHFTMVALDQRPPIANLVASRRNIQPTEVTFADMVAVKRLLVDTLADNASAMLLDPNYAFVAALDRLPAHIGLVVTLEDHRFRDTPSGRLSHSIPDWSVSKIRRAGGDGVKVLAWYRPDAGADVVAHQKDYVRQIGQDCRQHDIPFILELLVYPFLGSTGHTANYVESPEKLPPLVLDSVREFAKPEYGVDLFKLESPLPGASLPAPDGSPAHQQAQALFDELGRICRSAREGRGVPWVMLSAGVTGDQFLRVMAYAYAAGANGFLAGRAIWWDALQQFPDVTACHRALTSQGQKIMNALCSLTKDAGTAWAADYSALAAIQAEGQLSATYD